MRKGAAAIAVSERPDPRDVGGEPVINLDVSARVHLDAGSLKTEVVGVWSAPHREQHMRANPSRLAFPAVDTYFDTLLVGRQADALGGSADIDTLVRQNLS